MQLVLSSPATQSVSVSSFANKRGKELGHRYSFIGQTAASSVRSNGKATGLKGAKLDDYVNAALKGDKATMAGIAAQAFVATCVASGYVPTLGETRKSSACLKFEKASVKAVEATVDRDALADKTADVAVRLLVSKGMTEADAKAAIRAEMAK